MTKRALGIFPTYPAPYTLNATPNDRANWVATFPKRGFTSVSLLEGAGTTRAAIIAKIQQFVASLVTGDSATIVFCGHGSLVGASQCIVSTDIMPVYDYEIQSMLALLPTGAKCDVVLDCCYAGTGSYDAGMSNWKDAPPNLDKNVVSQAFSGTLTPAPKDALLAASRAVPTKWREWAACGPSQVSYEVLSGGKWQSLFTLYLAWALRTYQTMTASQIIEKVKPYIVAVVPAQVPQLTGMPLDQVPF